MHYKVTFIKDEFADEIGPLPAVHKEFDIPYQYWEKVWYCYKKGKKYVVCETRIKGIWATNMVGVMLSNDWYIAEDDFYRLFKDKNEAIDWCLKQNQRGAVKVYEMY